jgi:DNA-binding FrmR family transcriptional regulator
VLAAACLILWGCGGQAPKAEGGLGQAAGDTAHDTAVLKLATAAANEVIRAAGDCPKVQEQLEAAQHALDEAAKEVRTATGRTSLEALGRQVRHVAEACP